MTWLLVAGAGSGLPWRLCVSGEGGVDVNLDLPVGMADEEPSPLFWLSVSSFPVCIGATKQRTGMTESALRSRLTPFLPTSLMTSLTTLT